MHSQAVDLVRPEIGERTALGVGERVGGGDDARDPKVADLDGAEVGGQEDVLGLEVAVEEVELAVAVGEGVDELRDVPEQLELSERPLLRGALLDERAEVTCE